MIRNFIAAQPACGERSGRLQALRNFLLGNGAALDDAPVRLGNIDRRGPWTGTVSAIQNEIDAAVHHSEYVDTADACWMTGNIGAGGNQRLIEERHELRYDYGRRLAQGQSPRVTGDLERDLGRGRNNDGQRTGP